MSTLAPSAARPVAGTHLPTFAFETGAELARAVAQEVATIIRERKARGQNAVLGLPTGSTPVGVYRELIRLHREEGLDFSNVITFNLDEYFGMPHEGLQSYHRWMRAHFFDHVNVPPQNIHIPDGTVPLDQVARHCREYEQAIEAAGGIDLMLLGVGRNGHIGFNEPQSLRTSRTRLCTLDPVTRLDAASNFFGEENVPLQALTMGVGTILAARKILLLALGEHKAKVIRQVAEGQVNPSLPASYLLEHNAASIYVDSAAGGGLTGIATPWVLGNLEWSDPLIKRAMLWLCEQTGKALLKLSDDDFRKNHLHQLLRHHGPAEAVSHRVFKWMMDTIDYHPAGKGERKRVICFSPHPDDDVISMGGTLIRLVNDGHEVHVAYMTSGNIAVFDHDAQRAADFVAEFNRRFGIDTKHTLNLKRAVCESLRKKHSGEPDIEQVREIKGLIRWSEAKAGAIKAGCQEEHLHFLDLPFYRTGTIDKKPLSGDDVAIIRALLDRVKPHQVYIAGDLSDPHGTHRVCADAAFRALLSLECETGSRPEALLYRGAWQEYHLHEIEIAVPLSPSDLDLKRAAIFMHESQKDEALFPGSDPREFWQRADDRNKGTSDKYNRIGLPEYYAMEAFVRWNGVPI